jgi:hypothetical protein
MEPHDSGWPFERTPHHDDSMVLFQVCDRFGSAADVIQVGDFAGSENPERIEAFGRQVHMASRTERSRRDKEHLLRIDEGLQTSVDFFVQLAH